MSIRITNIQRMCFEDGPGIRTTVFLKGCSIHCPWCSNPENLSYGIECINGEVCGKDYEPEELYKIITKDKDFWDNDGGITFSGGEALLQMYELTPLCEMLHDNNINIAIETSLFAPSDCVIESSRYIDFYYVDIKILDAYLCDDALGGDIAIFRENLDYLAKAEKEVHFRIPCSYEYTLTRDNRDRIIKLVNQYDSFPIEIFSVHNLGEYKYKKMKKECVRIKPVSENVLEEFRKELSMVSKANVNIISI